MRWIDGAFSLQPRGAMKPARRPATRLTLEPLEDRLAPATTNFQSIIGLPAVQSAYPYNGAGESVAILDTGIDYNDTDLGAGVGPGHRVLYQWNFLNNTANAVDDNGHGTLLAGIIGSSNPNDPGIAPDINFIDLKVLDSNMNGNWSAIDNALQWVIKYQAAYNIVGVNLSLGSGNYASNPYSFLESDFSNLKSLGVFTAIASGNNFYTYGSQPGLAYPAISPNVVSVGATWAGNFGANTWSSGATDYSSAVDQILSVTQRSSSLDILAPGAWITSDGLNNTTLSMGGTSMAAAVVSGSAALLHQALEETGKSALANQTYILNLMQSTGVTIVDNSTASNVVPTGLSFKRLNLAAAMSAVGQPVAPPVFAPIANQTLPVGSTIVVPLSVTNPGATPISYTWTQVYLPALAYQLKQQYGFQYLGSYYTNSRGANEKWITGANNIWYAIMPTGQVYRWTGAMASTLTAANLVATLDPSFYADPSKLWNAPYAGMPPTVFSLSGNKLSIRSPAYWTGTYGVVVTASNGTYSVTQAFNVTEVPANTPPVLTAIANQTMPHAQHSLTLNLSAYDANAVPIVFSAQVVPSNGQTPAVALAVQGNQLTINPALSFVGAVTVQVSANAGGLTTTETFTVTVTDTAPVLAALANQSASNGQATVVNLSATDADGDALTYSAQVLPVNGATPPLNATVSGNTLTLQPTQPTAGTFTIQVSVTDGALTATRTFNLTLTNTAPTLAAIAAQTMAANQTSITVPLSASDAANNPLTFQAVVETPGALAYQLNQQYAFQPANATYYQNLYGLNEKWLIGKNNLWYVILPSGQLYRWSLSISQTLTAANLVATLDPKYYVEPRLLWTASPPTPPALTITFAGNQMTIQRPATLTGVFFIDVTVSDGFTTTTQTMEIYLN